MSEVLDKIRRELDAFAEKKKAFVEELRKDFPLMFKDLIGNAKTFESVSWNQYTPYFNDGEECTFSAHVDYLMVDGNYDDEREDLKKVIYGQLLTEEDVEFNNEFERKSPYFRPRKLGDRGYVKNPNFDPHDGEIFQSIKTVLGEIPEDFLKELFGDHAQITIRKDGTIDVSEYEHD